MVVVQRKGAPLHIGSFPRAALDPWLPRRLPSPLCITSAPKVFGKISGMWWSSTLKYRVVFQLPLHIDIPLQRLGQKNTPLQRRWLPTQPRIHTGNVTLDALIPNFLLLPSPSCHLS